MPRVSAFARLANGAVAPKRVLEGQATHLSRTMHGMDFDVTHDEFFIPVALSGAVLTFPGGAGGAEPPKRAIQGSKTGLVRPQTIAVDPVHNELYVGDPSARAVYVFRRTDDGNVAPIRVLQGPKSKLVEVTSVAVDPVHDLLIAGQRGPTPQTTGLLIFNRTDNGDVAPRAIIAGPKTRMYHFRQVTVDPKVGKIYVAVQDIWYKPEAPYAASNVRSDYSTEKDEEKLKWTPSPFDPSTKGFIGVWDIHDDGDVPPRAVIRGPESRLLEPGGVALDPGHGEVIAVDGGVNGYQVYLVPQFFQSEFWSLLANGLRPPR